MFNNNILEFGGTRIEFFPHLYKFKFTSFKEVKGELALLEYGEFYIDKDQTLIMSNGSHRGIKEIIIINTFAYNKNVVKIPFAIIPKDIDKNTDYIDLIISALKNKQTKRYL